MVSDNALHQSVSRLVEMHLPIARVVASRLGKAYRWVDADDLYSYSLWGLMQAARAYSPDKGVPFAAFAMRKAAFLAIDRMRQERTLHRRPSSPEGSPGAYCPVARPCSLTESVPDLRSNREMDALAIRDSVQEAMRRLAPQDRQLLMMHYFGHMTFREIACVFDLTESAIVHRHKTLLARLRRGTPAGLVLGEWKEALA